MTDLDLTLVRTLGADGKVTVTAPYTLATVSATPSLGLTGTDTSIAHVEFATAIDQAVTKYGATCNGPNPSETNMGLAVWLASALTAVDKDQLAGVTYTKQFEIVATAGVRFGYTLTPVTNTVSADIGGSGTHDRTSRFSIAMTPPNDTPTKAIPVYIVTPQGKQKLEIQSNPPPVRRGAISARSRAVSDPVIQYLLQRRSPVKIGP